MQNINKEIEFVNEGDSYKIRVNNICIYDMGAYLSNMRLAILKVPENEYNKLEINYQNAKYVDADGNYININDVHPSVLFDTFLVPAHFAIKQGNCAKFKLNREFAEFIKKEISKGKERCIKLPLSKLETIVRD